MRIRHKNGFTLIELMIVITIIGVMAGVIGLSVFTGDPAKEAQKEAKRFIVAMTMALDESAFNQQDLGIHLEDDGYNFLVWALQNAPEESTASGDGSAEEAQSNTNAQDSPPNGSGQSNEQANEPKPTWQFIEGESALKEYLFPEDIRVEIEIEDSELIGESDIDGDTELTETNLNLDEIGPEVEEQQQVDPPHVYILSSGELTPAFRVGFYHVEKPDDIFYVVGDEMGRVGFEPDEFADEF